MKGRPFDSQELHRQIGLGNVLAISGGRSNVIVNENGETVEVQFPVSNGYRVSVALDWNDTWTVSREFVRAGRVFDKGTVTDVYCEQVGEVAYRASCFHDSEFGTVGLSIN